MYCFYIKGVLLPVTPGEVTAKIKGNNKTLTLANGGDMNFLHAPGLTEISFDAMLPMLGKYSFANSYQRPDYYLGIFEKLMNDKAPFQFVISRFSPSGVLLYDTNMKVSLEEYTITENAENGPDVTVSLTLKQYIEYATKIVTVVMPTTTEDESEPIVSEETPRDTSSAPEVKTYTVRSGDCLWNIAKRYYGDGSQYPKIFDANRDQIQNPNLIYEGQVLVIP